MSTTATYIVKEGEPFEVAKADWTDVETAARRLRGFVRVAGRGRPLTPTEMRPRRSSFYKQTREGSAFSKEMRRIYVDGRPEH